MDNKKLFRLAHKNDFENFKEAILKVGKKLKIENFVLNPGGGSSCGGGDSLLHVLCQLGNVEMLRFLCHSFPNLNLNPTHPEGKALLHEAAQYQRLDVAKFLLQECQLNADPLKRSDWTPLMLACTKPGNLNMVNLLLSSGADPDLRNKDGWTPFHLAVRTGDIDVVAFLLHLNPQAFKTRSNNGRTPLHTAALSGNLPCVHFLLEHCPFEVDQRDSCGNTPILDAVRGGAKDPKAEVVQALMQGGHSLCAGDVFDRNALHIAAHSGNLQAFEFIVEKLSERDEFNLDIRTKNGMTALHWAAFGGQSPIIDFLLNSMKCDVNLRDFQGRTALDIAKDSKHEACMDILKSVTKSNS